MRNSIYSAISALALLSVSCTKENLTVPQKESANSAAVVSAMITGHFIGERFGGGVIFYIYNTGQHGLIADTVDMPATTWYNGTYFITGITNTDIGAGKSNTRSIIQQQGRTGNYAALECVKSRKGGLKDWYLPSRDELSQLYLHQNVGGTFSYGYYWSSSEIHDSSLFSWGVYFYSGVQYANQKNYIGFVRAIRSF